MLWIVLIILVIAAAYYVYNNYRAGRALHDQTNYLDVKQASNSGEELHGQHTPARPALHNDTSAKADLLEQSKAAPHDGPSLLYADRNAATDTELTPGTSTSSADQMTRAENLPIDNAIITADTMDFTAETATLNSDEVGLPANSNEYEQSNQIENPLAATQTDPSISHGTNAANAQTHAPHTTSEHHSEHNSNQPSDDNRGVSNGQAAVAIGAIAAGMAGAAKANTAKNTATSDTHSSTMAHPTSEGIDLELGDSTYNDGEALEDENDELLDFGDLTADISEMLKELNLRESDSPRLEINEEEYQQLKTGDPGEVKPAKIENVAGKLRNMLQ